MHLKKYLPLFVHVSTNGQHSWPEQNDGHFADDIFRCIFVKENYSILFQISLNHLALVPSVNRASIDSDNGLSPIQRQAII